MPFDILTEAQVGGQWIPVPTYERDPIEVEVGRPDMGSLTDPGRLRVTINNRSGRWSWRNPESDLYGLIGPNTRIRTSVPGTVSYLELDGNPANYASTPDHASLDITGDLDVRWEGEANWYASGGQYLIAKWGALGDQAWSLRLQDGDLYFVVLRDGSSGPFVNMPLPALPRRAAVRATLDADNGAAGFTVRMYWAPSLAGPWTQFGVDGTGATPVTIHNSAGPLIIAPDRMDAVPPRPPVTGRVYKAEVRNGIGGTVVASPDFTAQAAGTTSFADSAGRTWTLAGNAHIRDRDDLILAEVPEWPQEWTPDESDAWVPIEGAGVLRRLGQGKKALQSTLRRRLPSFGPLAYWPMEEGRDASQAFSPVPGVQPLSLTGATWASADTLASSAPLPVLATSGGTAAMMLGRVPAPATTPTMWQVHWVYHIEQGPTTRRTFMRITSTGTVREWFIQSGTTGTTLLGRDEDGATVVTHDIGTGLDLFGRWVNAKLTLTQSGGTVTYAISWREANGDAGFFDASISGSIGRPTGVGSPTSGFSTDLEGMAIGHVSVWTSDATNAYNRAFDAWTGETAWERMQRLAAEEGLNVARVPGPVDAELVGPQRMDTVLNLLQAAADADGGMLLEDRRIRPGGLVYRERSSLYSQTPALTLSYSGAPGLAAPLRPVDDDTAYRNDRTVVRDGGSEARAVLEEGRLSIAEPPDGIGLYDDSVTLSLHQDAQAEPIAYWRLHLGTVDAPRYPQVRVLLHKAPNLIPAVLALDEGDLLRITGLPKYVGGGTVDLLVEGIKHQLTLETWEVTFNCSPGAPWAVGSVSVSEDFSDSAYAFPITFAGTLPWTRSQAHYNSGTWALRSGAITNNQTSDAIVTVPAGATALTFWYWTSSEAAGPGFEGDRLLVLVDGVQVLRAQGTTPWTQTTIDVTGKSAVTFRYAKDNSSAVGEDAVYIDDLLFTMPAPSRVDANPGGSTVALAASATATQLLVHTPARDALAPTPWITSAGPGPTYPEDFPLDIRLGGEVARVTSCTPVGWDTFTRTVANGWGTADNGLPWVEASGATSDRSVNGTAGVLTLAATKDVIRQQRLVGSITDCEVVVRVSVDQVAVGAALMPAILLRFTDTLNFYRARLHFDTLGFLAVSVTRGTTVIGSTVPLLPTYTAGQWFWLRARLTGHRVQVRAWADGNVEPGLWHADQTITTSPIASGQVGLAGSSLTTNTNANPQLRYDNFTIVTPQTMTVQRSRNGIVKGHSVGTEVRVDQPAVIAL